MRIDLERILVHQRNFVSPNLLLNELTGEHIYFGAKLSSVQKALGMAVEFSSDSFSEGWDYLIYDTNSVEITFGFFNGELQVIQLEGDKLKTHKRMVLKYMGFNCSSKIFRLENKLSCDVQQNAILNRLAQNQIIIWNRRSLTKCYMNEMVSVA